MSTINEAAILRFYVDTQEYSDRLTAIEAQAASSIATHKTEVAAAIAQVNLTQSQTITALTLEVSNLKTDLTNSITATQTDLINRADELAQDVTDITQQLTQDKATFTQEIQDALDYLKDDASVASALRTPRKIQGVDFDGTQDISLPTFTAETDGLVPKRVGATTTKYLREDGSWVAPTNTPYPLLTKAIAETGTATASNTISAQVLKDAIQFHAPTVTSITGNAETATKLQTARTINGVAFDGTQNISLPVPEAYSLPTASASVLGGIKVGSGLDISNSILSVGTLNQSTTGNAATATKLVTPRKINGVSFDGTRDINLDVYNKSEVDTAIASAAATPDATETIAGKAKIATTAIAQAGSNDTEFLTAKKLRDALNATGFAPVYACRAWVNFNGTGTPSIRKSGNVSSITDNGVGNYTINFTLFMPDANYSFSGFCNLQASVASTGILSFGNDFSMSAASLRVKAVNATTGDAQDAQYITVCVFR